MLLGGGEDDSPCTKHLVVVNVCATYGVAFLKCLRYETSGSRYGSACFYLF
jgi:hypothetical protein